MPYLTNKPRKTSAWLPTQVDYGMDVSDPEPSNWKPFGRYAEETAAKSAAEKQRSAVKAAPQAQ